MSENVTYTETKKHKLYCKKYITCIRENAIINVNYFDDFAIEFVYRL